MNHVFGAGQGRSRVAADRDRSSLITPLDRLVRPCYCPLTSEE